MRFPELHIRRHGNFVRGLFGVCLLSSFCLSPTYAAPAENKVLKLDGSGSYVELPPDLFKDLTQATVEVWVKWNSFRSYSRVFEFGAAWNAMSMFNHATTSDIRFNLYPRPAQFDTSLQYQIRVPGVLHSNEWVHLAAVTGPVGMKLYANGVLIGKHTNTASFADLKVRQINLLGRGLVRNPTDRDFRGEIDELRVWNYPRSAIQIRDDMHKRLTGHEEGLAHLWNFDDDTVDDLVSAAGAGKLHGGAEIVPGGPFQSATDAKASAAAVTGAAPVATAAASVPARQSDGISPAWWIAGAMTVLVGLLAWLMMMLRRSGLGSAKLPHAAPAQALTSGPGPLSQATLPPAAHDDLKQQALAELTDFAKQSLVQGLYSQRAALLEAQKKAQQELVELEARLATLQLPDRIRAYERRIHELEGEVATRGDEVRELTNATLLLLRQKLEEEKELHAKSRRFN